jgi:hypothetical protein
MKICTSGLLYVPVYWLLLYYMWGNYKDVWRRSRLRELTQTFTLTLYWRYRSFFPVVA